MLTKSWILCFVLGYVTSFTYALDADSSIILSYKEYLNHVLDYHPIARKAQLRTEMGRATLMEARGRVDPSISSDWSEKNFDDKLYYRQYQAKLKVPTRLGLDLVAGYENSEGAFLDPESTTDDQGLWQVGIEADLLQGLFMNERKMAMQQARIFEDLTENERLIMLNDLLLNASVQYFAWQQIYHFQLVLDENVSLASSYLDNTRDSYLGGEKTAIDTLEAFILLQDAMTSRQKNQLSMTKARQNIENFLWFEETPVVLEETTRPEDLENPIFEEVQALELSQLGNHPLLQVTRNKISFLEIAQWMKREKLKPKLRVGYYPLLATGPTNIAPIYSSNNFKWGFDFKLPLLRRFARGQVLQGAVKLNEIRFDLQNKSNELQNKLEGSRLQLEIFRSQIQLLRDNIDAYRRLLEAENEKFRYGESSVFLLNKRQEKYINSRLKFIEAFIKQRIEMLNYRYFSNQLHNE